MAQNQMPPRIDQSQRPKVKRGKITLTRKNLYDLLEVPLGVDITAVSVSQDPLLVTVHLTGDRLPTESSALRREEPESREVDALIVQASPQENVRVVWVDNDGHVIPGDPRDAPVEESAESQEFPLDHHLGIYEIAVIADRGAEVVRRSEGPDLIFVGPGLMAGFEKGDQESMEIAFEAAMRADDKAAQT